MTHTRLASAIAVIAVAAFSRSGFAGTGSSNAAPGDVPAQASPAPSPSPGASGTLSAPPTANPTATPAQATIYLNDGSVIRGEIVEVRSGTTIVHAAAGEFRIEQSSIRRIDYGSTATTSTPPPQDVHAAPAVAGHPAIPGTRPHRTFGASLLLGEKSLPKHDWGTFDRQTAFGLAVNIHPYAPVGGEVNWVISELTKDGTHASTAEFVAGPRFYLGNDTFQLTGALGLGFASASIKPQAGSPESGTGAGFWSDVGLKFVVSPRAKNTIVLGTLLRYSTAQVKIGGVKVEAGGTTFLGTVGLEFGK